MYAASTRTHKHTHKYTNTQTHTHKHAPTDTHAHQHAYQHAPVTSPSHDSSFAAMRADLIIIVASLDTWNAMLDLISDSENMLRAVVIVVVVVIVRRWQDTP